MSIPLVFFAGAAKSSMVSGRVSWYSEIKLCRDPSPGKHQSQPHHQWGAPGSNQNMISAPNTPLPTSTPNPSSLPSVGSPDWITRCQEAMSTHNASSNRTLDLSVAFRKGGEVSCSTMNSGTGPSHGLKKVGNNVQKKDEQGEPSRISFSTKILEECDFPFNRRSGSIALFWRPSSFPGTQA